MVTTTAWPHGAFEAVLETLKGCAPAVVAGLSLSWLLLSCLTVVLSTTIRKVILSNLTMAEVIVTSATPDNFLIVNKHIADDTRALSYPSHVP